jgi:hypothetical protein
MPANATQLQTVGELAASMISSPTDFGDEQPATRPRDRGHPMPASSAMTGRHGRRSFGGRR